MSSRGWGAKKCWGLQVGGEKEWGLRWIEVGIPMRGGWEEREWERRVGEGEEGGWGAATHRDQTINPPVRRISGKHDRKIKWVARQVTWGRVTEGQVSDDTDIWYIIYLSDFSFFKKFGEIFVHTFFIRALGLSAAEETHFGILFQACENLAGMVNNPDCVPIEILLLQLWEWNTILVRQRCVR